MSRVRLLGGHGSLKQLHTQSKHRAMFFDVPSEIALLVFLINVTVACYDIGRTLFDACSVACVCLEVFAFLGADIDLAEHAEFGIEGISHAAAKIRLIP